jgi:hypothetical protein
MNAPWTVREMAGVWHGPAVQDAEGLGVAFVCGAGTDKARADQLAKVIAAAPDLLAACYKLIDSDAAAEEDERKHQLMLAKLLAARAVAKAEGRE